MKTKAIRKQPKKAKEDNKIVFSGELTGTPRNHKMSDFPIISVKFHENGSVITTIGNSSFMPSAKDLVNAKASMNQLAKILDIDKAKVIVGAWMDRVAK